MSEAEEEIEGEEGSTGPAEVPMPSEVQLKLAEQGNYLATNLNALFATTMQLNVTKTQPISQTFTTYLKHEIPSFFF